MNDVAQTDLKRDVSVATAEAFFRSKLADIDEPTAPYGLLDAARDGTQVVEAREQMDRELARRIRRIARLGGTSAATIFHAAWALVVAHTSGRDDVAFGTLLSTRPYGDSDAQPGSGVLGNILPLRLPLRDVTATQLIDRVERELNELSTYAQISLAIAQACSGVAGSTALFGALFIYRDSVSKLSTQARADYPLMVAVDDLGEAFMLNAQTDRRIDPQRITAYLHVAVRSLVDALEQDSKLTVLGLTILPAGERHQLLELFNATPTSHSESGLIHELFQEQVERAPEAVAVACGNVSFTYRELNGRANQLARALRACDAGPNERVALCMPRSADMVVGLMAILKAGAAYVPLDPEYPAERLAYMLDDVAPKVVLTQQNLVQLFPRTEVRIIAVDTQWDEVAAYAADNLDSAAIGSCPQDLAYVIYTSGSTGRPKGVMVEHGNVLALWRGLAPVYECLNPNAAVALNASLNFDASVQQIVQLLAGRRIEVVPQSCRQDAAMLLDFLEQREVAAIDCTPSQLRAWLAAGLLSRAKCPLRTVLVGGEAIGPDLWGSLARCSSIAFYNVYGPTECTVDSTIAHINEDFGAPHIGRPMSGRRLYVLGHGDQPAPLGALGEIHIGGAGIARGYWNRPELSAERFVPDLHAADPYARRYKTGDLARWRADGVLEYVGRNDQQVKVRGYRIEMGEIEAQLMRSTRVKDAAVIVREDASGDKRLVAYVVAAKGAGELLVEELRSHLKSVLPDYMIPNAFVSIERLPLTPSGKLDRRALPAPQFDAYLHRHYEPPRGRVEEIVAEIWQDVLRVDRVGRHDNFFELGGHSLLVAQVLERLRTVGLWAEVRQAFESQSLSELASALTSIVAEQLDVPTNRIPPECDAITPNMLPLVELTVQQIQGIAARVPGGASNIQDIYPLASSQEGILFHHLLNEDSGDTYVVSVVWSVDSRERLDALLEALQATIDRHDVLRTAVIWKELARPVQVVYRQATLPIGTLALDPARDRPAQVREWLKLERQRFDIDSAPLMRVKIARDDHSDAWYVLLQLHHLTTDHVAVEIIASEVVAMLEEGGRQLPPPLPYRNHVARSLAYSRTHDVESFFRGKLEGIAESTAPFGLLDIRGDGRRIEEARQPVEPELASRIRGQARRLAVSAATLFHAAWGLVVAHTSGREDVVFGSVFLGRMQERAGAKCTVGMFINTVPLRLRLSGVTSRDLVEQTQRELVDLLTHELAPLAVAQRCSGIEGSAPLFTALLNYVHSAPDAEAEWPSARGIRVIAAQERTNYPVTMSVEDAGERFTLVAQTDRSLDPRRVTAYLCTAIQSLAEALEQAPQTPALALPILPASERRQIVDIFNATQAPYPRDRAIHVVFEEQAQRAPSAPAVAYGGESLTYAQLNGRANQLARYLCSNGLAAGEYVPVLMSRSLQMVVVQLALLKSGAVYLPIDPELPAERREFMVRDCGAARVISQAGRVDDLAVDQLQWIDCDAVAEDIARQSVENLPLPVNAAAPAYVMYTSGSTGLPKGVVVPHRAVNRLVVNAGYAQIGAGDCILHHSNPAFDASTFEVWGALLNGARVVVVPQEVVLDGRRFADVLARERVTLLYMSVGLFNQYVTTMAQVLAQLRYLFVGGDSLEPGVIRRVLSSMPPQHLLNAYGPTECTTFATTHLIESVADDSTRIPIGRPLSNTQLFILDVRGQVVPIGVAGELYIGGDGVACGYLNRPELTAERFVPDRFSSQDGARMYKTGDFARWRADGTVEYLGRNDQQVKIRGFRIELGEIESCLARHPLLSEVAVLARQDMPGERRLVAYVVPKEQERAPSSEELRSYLRTVLPEYMVPNACVVLQRMPLTSSGKVDRRALPAPELSVHGGGVYEPPQGEAEQILAGIWQTLLGVDGVGRRDNFFELGGHSLLIVQMMELLRRVGLTTEVRRVFESATLMDLAAALRSEAAEQRTVPPNLIPEDCAKITPQMLPLVTLEAEQIERIARTVPGGAGNIKDIYPLAPLQEGILFHHLLDQQTGDTYVLPVVLEVASRERLDELIAALQSTVDRHDVLRTAVLWEELARPVQVVYRQATVPVQELTLDPQRDPVEQIGEWLRPERQRLDLRRAPLMCLQVAPHPRGVQWYALLQLHHMTVDHVSAESVVAEVVAHLEGRAQRLAVPLPYRNHVAQSLAYASTHDAEAFFRDKLGSIDEPTAPFGLMDVHGDGTQIEEAQAELEAPLARQVRVEARRLAVSPATLFHAAWGLVVARTSGRSDVVFGSVLLGRLQGTAGAEHTLGMFINTLPLRLRLGAVTAKELAEQAQRELVELLGHEQASLAVAQRCSGVHGSAPLFTALLNYRHSAPIPDTQWSAAHGIRVIAESDRTNYPITVSVDDLGEGFKVTAQTDRRIDPRRLISYLHTAVQSLVVALAKQPQTPALDLEILPPGEREEVITLFNQSERLCREDTLIHELFEEHVRRTPDALAVSCEGQSLTYAELDRRANQLATHLVGRGVGPDELVALCVERSLDLVVGLLGILKAGAGYLPLDPHYPTERLRYMLNDAAPRVTVTQASLRHMVADARTETIAIDEDWPAIAANPGDNPQARRRGLRPEHLAYVIYTSGSTGNPKGVMVEHRNVTRLFAATDHWFQFDERDVWTLFHSFAFDFSVWELWGALFYGGHVIVVPYLTARSPREFYELVCEQGVTVLNQTPSAFAQLIDAQAHGPQRRHSLRVVIFGGEALDLHTLQPWVKRNGGEQPQLVNMYGITETTVHVTYRPLTEAEIWSERASVIGRPIPDLRVYVLDRHKQPLPVGIAGEMYVGGDGVARGYLHRPELTAERFVADPFSDDPQARMYKSGDLARWRRDGTLEYLGRNDDQVKLRGFRIELGEIEAQLAALEQVKDAAVIAREDTPGAKRLVAYVVPQDDCTPGSEALRTRLKEVLPEYMVPAAFVLLEHLPLTSNGKLDRRALPVPELDAYATRHYEAPCGEVEEIVAGIWQSLLRLERVGRQDNFFELGGHSLLIVQMMERLRRVGLFMEVRRAFESATLADLAAKLTRDVAEQFEVPANRIPQCCEAITADMLPLIQLEPQHIERIVQAVPGGAANIADIYPLAPLQEGLLFHHLMSEGGGDAYVLPELLQVSSHDRLEALISALQSVIDRHDVLRTAVLWDGLPRPVQVVYRHATLPVEVVVLDPAHEVAEQLRSWLKPERQWLNLRQAPLMRLLVAADPGSEKWYVLWQLHHIIDDATSLRLVIAEVIAHLEGRAELLPPSVPYRNHVAQSLAYARANDAEAFFRRKLGDMDEPTAPFGLMDVHGDGTDIEEAHENLDVVLAQRIRTQARRLAVSAATLFHAAWAMVVAHTSGRDDVVFGSVLLGRLQGTAGAQRTLGMFINTLPLRSQLRDVSVREFVDRTQHDLVELLSHEQASLAAAQRCSGIAGAIPLFTALLNYRHGAPDLDGEWSETSGITVLAGQERTNYPITVSVDDLGAGFRLTALTDRRIDPHRVAGYLQTALNSLVQALEQSEQAAVLSLTILPEGERELLTNTFNATDAPYPREKRVHELFEEQVVRTPQAIAVLHEGNQLTYAELNAKANQVARALRTRGIGPDVVVGICIERGLNMVIGLLATMKAGGAYLPVDPNYPSERLRYMLEDAGPRVVLTQRHLRPLLPEMQTQIVEIEDELRAAAQNAADDLSGADRGCGSGNLVYVIYTSGSTGRPKGTAMPHASMINLIEWHRRTFGDTSRRVLQFAALSFDVAFQEIFSTLCTGGTLVLLDEWVRRDAGALMELLSACSIDRLFVPPLMLQSLAEHFRVTRAAPMSLKDVIVAGEQLRISAEIVDLFKRLAGCRLHNHYGPTETHVVTALTLADAPDRWPALPSIGSPIANCRIHILNKFALPVPLGASGEIYIGGANVARGYLHRPELTKERFVPDPFSSDPQARLYKTGDLGIWRADGTIEYLGRNDYQVKIRGFRVELGEIEALLSAHERVKDAVLLVREDASGAKRLVAYITLRDKQDLRSDDLRAHLQGTLPEHMIPSAFVVLDTLPLTPSGKLNRLALPPPDLAAYAAQAYEGPAGPIEETLAQIWRAVLSVERVGRDDNFFDLGGHSLLALKLLLEVNQALGRMLRVTDIYANPTIRKLAACVDEDARRPAHDELVNLATEAVLDDSIVPIAGKRRTRPEAILLTGATGFVGRFLLAQLLRETDATIYCLVRATSQNQAATRLRGTLLRWDLWDNDHDGRIVAIPGDLRMPRLGIEDSSYEMLCRNVDSIYHCGTSMNHLETYAMAKPANVGSARELLKLATAHRPKVINYVSTLGVFSPVTAPARRVVDETSPIDHEVHSAANGYAASKWVAEHLLLTASRRGIPCNIFRLGLVWADSERGRYDELQREYRVLKSCLLSGCGIEGYRYASAPIPVDYAARAIVVLAERHPGGGGTFHISASTAAREGVFERCNEIAGTALELVSFYEWTREIARLHHAGRSLPVVPLIEFTFAMNEESLLAYQQEIESSNLEVNSRRTCLELDRTGLVAPAFDDELLRKCVEDMLLRDQELREEVDADSEIVGTGLHERDSRARRSGAHAGQ